MSFMTTNGLVIMYCITDNVTPRLDLQQNGKYHSLIKYNMFLFLCFCFYFQFSVICYELKVGMSLFFIFYFKEHQLNIKCSYPFPGNNVKHIVNNIINHEIKTALRG